MKNAKTLLNFMANDIKNVTLYSWCKLIMWTGEMPLLLLLSAAAELIKNFV